MAMDYSIYLHVPFCKRRCHYCDFNTYAGKERFLPDYIDALIKEVRIVNNVNPHKKIHSIYFGGGTPSLVPISLYRNLLEELKNQFDLTPDCEISLEANPGTLTSNYLSSLIELGFNRISIGIQSTNPDDLIRLDRIHNVQDILESVRNARIAGFKNINLDMIYGLPWQSLQSWEFSLSRALELAPTHLSLYSLIIEPGTELYRWFQEGKIAEQNQDLEADMFELAMEMLDDYGYYHYEISNWAKVSGQSDFRCRHNLQYWLNQPYFGFGAGAHGYVDHMRTENIKTIPGYIQRFERNSSSIYPFPSSPATSEMTIVDRETAMKDFMMLGLRLIEEGVSAERFQENFGAQMTNVFQMEINDLLDKHLVEWVGTETKKLRLSERGVMVGNQAFMAFV